MNAQFKRNETGFTLIEIVIALVLLGLVLSITTSYFYSGNTETYKPVDRLVSSAQLNAAMEAIANEYSASAKNTAALDTLISKVNSFSGNYGTYCSGCTASAVKQAVGALANTNAAMVTVSLKGESIYHVFTSQAD